MKENLLETSRHNIVNTTGEFPSVDQLIFGCLQRIANSQEGIERILTRITGQAQIDELEKEISGWRAERNEWRSKCEELRKARIKLKAQLKACHAELLTRSGTEQKGD